ncbi:MAG: hypothetical protein HQL30_03280 [Candidatus Omnitrophica bacterium]|nr:hypothetical protein [Candidatus Omnitrophota bacterium]
MVKIIKTAVFVIVAMVAIEAGSRFWFSDVPGRGCIVKDAKLGWKTRPGYTYKGFLSDNYGISYEQNIKYDDNGFISFGSLKPKGKKKVLFIGDGVTQSIYMPNAYTYPRLLANSLAIEIFVYAVEGYGMLQKYLVLEEWIKKIDPDIIVFQTRFTDIVYADPMLEAECYSSGFIARTHARPYLSEKGEIFYKNSYRGLFFLGLDLGSVALSEIGNIIYRKLYLNRQKEQFAKIRKGEDKSYERARGNFETVLVKIKAIVPSGKKIYIIPSDEEDPFFKDIQAAAEKNGITFVGIVPKAVRYEGEHGSYVWLRSSWDAKGQNVVAQVLAGYLSKDIK